MAAKMSAPARTSVITKPPHRAGTAFSGDVRIYEIVGRVHDTGWESWLDYGHYRLKEAYALEDDWDLQGARAVSIEAYEAAWQLIEQLNRQRVIRPFVGANPEGGITLEWSDGSVDLILDVLSEAIEVGVEDAESGDFLEGTLEDLEVQVSRALDALTE